MTARRPDVRPCPHPEVYDRGECCGGDCLIPASAQHLTDAPYPGMGHSTSPRTSSE